MAAKAPQCYTPQQAYGREAAVDRGLRRWPAPSSKGRLRKRRKFHQIVLRHRLQRLSHLPPGRQPSDDHERVESFFPQQMRHPGAGRFARSSTVQINVLILGKILDLLFKIVWLNPD